MCHGSPRNDDPAMSTATLITMPALTPPATPAAMTATMHAHRHARHQARCHVLHHALRHDIEAFGDVGPLWGIRNPPRCTGIRNLEPHSLTPESPQPQPDAAYARNPEPRLEPSTPQCHSTQGLEAQGDARPLRGAGDLPDCAGASNLKPTPLAPLARHRAPLALLVRHRALENPHPLPYQSDAAHACQPRPHLEPCQQADRLRQPGPTSSPLALGPRRPGSEPSTTGHEAPPGRDPTLGG